VKSFVYLEDHDKYDEMNKYYGEFSRRNRRRGRRWAWRRCRGFALEITCIDMRTFSREAIGSRRRTGRIARGFWRGIRCMSRARETN